MKDLLFFAAVYGLAVSLAVLAVGSPVRFLFSTIDATLFPAHRREQTLGETRKVGPIYILIHCPACLSFWIGMGFSWLVYSPAKTHLASPLIPALAVDGLASAGIIWIVHVVLTKLGQYEL